jgi:hypothetical protein
MPHLISKTPEIDNLWIDLLPSGRVINIEKAVRVENTIILRTKDGRLYTTHPLRNYSYMPGMYGWTDSFMRALVKLKVITKAQCDQHITQCEVRDEKKKQDYARKRFQQTADEAGIKLTKRQLKIAEDRPKHLF